MPEPTRYPIPVCRLGVAIALVGLLAGCVVAPHGPARPRPVYAESGPPSRPAAENVDAARMFFYPQRDQTTEQMDRDRYECYRWAARESGHDPGMTPLKPPPRELPPTALRDGSQVAGGAVMGAVTGAALASPRHAGEAAVIGAIFGAVLGSVAQESRAQVIESRQESRAAARQQAQSQRMDPFRRAMGACMSGRGYRVG
ncbi:MAG: hypothetical protein ACKVQR_20870 [Aquabacterium sp.]